MHDSRSLWLVASVTSAILLGGVFYVIDWQTATTMWDGVDWTMFAFGMLFLGAEGLFTTWRIGLLTPGNHALRELLRVTAWYVLLLVALPARLGEVAAVVLFNRYLSQSTGPACANILVQRLFDLSVLSAVFLLSLLLLGQMATQIQLLLFAGLVVVALAGVLWRLDVILSIAATIIVLTMKRYPIAQGKVALRWVLQARRWLKQELDRAAALTAAALTVGKWGCNLTGVALLLMALHLPLTLAECLWLGAAYNFLAAIPLQTVGGFGIAESGLTGLLALLDQPIPTAAAASILLRLGLISVPVLFWAAVMAWLATGDLNECD